jgi:hypothetical protein
MKSSLRSLPLIFIGLFSGLVVLIGYFIEIPILGELRSLFISWFGILAAVALMIGLVNLIRNHWRKITQRNPNAINSTILLGSMLATIALGLINSPTGPPLIWIYRFIIIPVEASLVALLAFVLIYTIARLFQKRMNWSSVVFLFTVLLLLAGSISFVNHGIPGLSTLKSWVEQVWALGGIRGILIGVALGTVIMSVRVLLGGEQPYQG